MNFKRPGGTSRGLLHKKETYFLIIKSEGKTGVGECGLFRGLSCDDRPDYQEKLRWLCAHIDQDEAFLYKELSAFPSIQFGLEQALLSLKATEYFDLFPSEFSQGKATIPINGLIWMGDEAFMKQQIEEKLASGFKTLKMKIGAIDFETELRILRGIRNEYGLSELELRVDANGAFSADDALYRLEQLFELEIHSIEQPVKAGQWELMADLCKNSPLPIALDEELIGVIEKHKQQALLEQIKPQYIILKPSLIGGFQGSKQWIQAAENLGIGWWITSALESNIGLNAIARFCYTLGNSMPQGLGTGSLFTNNIDAPLYIEQGTLCIDPRQKWSNLDDFIGE